MPNYTIKIKNFDETKLNKRTRCKVKSTPSIVASLTTSRICANLHKCEMSKTDPKPHSFSMDSSPDIRNSTPVMKICWIPA